MRQPSSPEPHATPSTPVQYMKHTSLVTCQKHISDVEAIGHDHVEDMSIHLVEGRSALMDAMRHERPEKTPHYHFSPDTIMISYYN